MLPVRSPLSEMSDVVINSLEYEWSLLILTYSLVSISAFCLLSVYLMLVAISVLVRVKGLP